MMKIEVDGNLTKDPILIEDKDYGYFGLATNYLDKDGNRKAAFFDIKCFKDNFVILKGLNLKKGDGVIVKGKFAFHEIGSKTYNVIYCDFITKSKMLSELF